MSYETIEVTQITPRIGGIVTGVNLAEPLNDVQIKDVHQALIDHQVIFFRDQKLDPVSLKRAGGYFGKLQPHALKGLPDHPEVRKLQADETSKHVSGEEWHTDMSCHETPPMASMLYLHTLPATGGDTLFASMYAAYDGLSEKMQEYLGGLTATHDGMLAFGRFDPNGTYPKAVHPVIREHPESKRKVIFVNRGFTSHINELTPKESRNLLDFLFVHIEDPFFQLRFRWEPHSVAFWDNRCTQHLAIWDYFPQLRSGYRVQLEDASMVG
ncbi:MAG: taurine dioxygenase [Gammaproteobacteria bacterium]|jgi:taurine dioxygenase